jgi:hypothetical protein
LTSTVPSAAQSATAEKQRGEDIDLGEAAPDVTDEVIGEAENAVGQLAAVEKISRKDEEGHR